MIWLVELVEAIRMTVENTRRMSYLLFGGWLTVYTAYVNLIANNRLFVKLSRSICGTTMVGPRRMCMIVKGIHLYRLELWRTIRLMMMANGSVMGKLVVPLVLFFNVPINIVLANTMLWKTEGVITRLWYTMFLIFQTCTISSFYGMFAQVSVSIHSTAGCFVPLQGQVSAMRTKMALMWMHERVNSDKSISLSLAGMVPITKQTMFQVSASSIRTVIHLFSLFLQFTFVYMAYFLTVTKLFI